MDVTNRFNERFLLSLSDCKTCLVVDDELNELLALKESLKETQPLGKLVGVAKTIDQAQALLTFVDAISAKTLKTTVSLTAGRGRGKSAALGLAVASAVSYGYSNIFITSPTPENLSTLFQFVFKGFEALDYQEHLDYDILHSMNPDHSNSVIRVNIFRNHRQTIQYISPSDSHLLSQAELVVIDEAAAIPLPMVKNLLGNWLVFLSSTINGYEGTGRSLSLKLIKQLRDSSIGFSSSREILSDSIKASGRQVKGKTSSDVTVSTGPSIGGRSLREVTLETPIRYSSNDPVESWLNRLLLLDACDPTFIPSHGNTTSGFSSLPTKTTPLGQLLKSPGGIPHPDKCELFHVNRDTLFSYHPVSEEFLKKVWTLFVGSHYKNSPNDLQLLR